MEKIKIRNGSCNSDFSWKVPSARVDWSIISGQLKNIKKTPLARVELDQHEEVHLVSPNPADDQQRTLLQEITEKETWWSLSSEVRQADNHHL